MLLQMDRNSGPKLYSISHKPQVTEGKEWFTAGSNVNECHVDLSVFKSILGCSYTFYHLCIFYLHKHSTTKCQEMLLRQKITLAYLQTSRVCARPQCLHYKNKVWRAGHSWFFHARKAWWSHLQARRSSLRAC